VTPKITSGVGMVFLLSALMVFGFSLYRSLHGIPSRGLTGLGLGLLSIGMVLGHLARKAAK
jgi:hypothetical protein